MADASSDAGKVPVGATGESESMAPGKVRKKMAVGEGRSMMHWINQRPIIKRQRWVTMAEIKKHNTSEDAWTVFRGKVYDCTSFFEYHPGGAKFMLAVAGKDGTKLFDKYHTWVNVDFIMEKCLIGLLKEDDVSSVALNEDDEDDDDESEEDSELARNTKLNAEIDAAAEESAAGTALDEMD
mmetsp:Transcript_18448/g.29432  ORF Transcript_18448/g.29432 Transcript_18448/m.29432 type:complete len:182 (-) Transcript_18448:28-573(-)|eukprot:CAMPEP_0179438286 /NCGR_PEP_ID=MMETSP0799-20121207/22042_1 /TAXON_ID=46947 /ORGANISM="Geminigera cryophila, Strain CCMP2564" /LENGTH=181 /DNA_ID=CAMNT_0021219797 /DNA_START=353 /DNA_END=898 /DNA_ORIENTATION=+